MDKIKAERIKNKEGWIGVDLDGTLAEFPEVYETYKIGKPIPAMVERVKKWIADGREVRIFTARVANLEVAPDYWRNSMADWHKKAKNDNQTLRHYIWSWLINCADLPSLCRTNIKDPMCIEIWDDRAVQVKFNTGEPVGEDYIR